MHWGEPQVAKHGTRDRMQASRFLLSTDGYASQDIQPESQGGMPFMDHWNVARPHVSLRDIIKEEQALQQNVEKVTQRPTAHADFNIFWHTNILNDVSLVPSSACTSNILYYPFPNFFSTCFLSDQTKPCRARQA